MYANASFDRRLGSLVESCGPRQSRVRPSSNGFILVIGRIARAAAEFLRTCATDKENGHAENSR
jgi:hypothetical protein